MQNVSGSRGALRPNEAVVQRFGLVKFLAEKASTIFCGAHRPTDKVASSFLAKYYSNDVIHPDSTARYNA